MLAGAGRALTAIHGTSTGRICAGKDATVCISSVAESAVTQADIVKQQRSRYPWETLPKGAKAVQTRCGTPRPRRRRNGAPGDPTRTAPCVGLCCAEGGAVVPHHIKVEQQYRTRVAKGRT